MSKQPAGFHCSSCREFNILTTYEVNATGEIGGDLSLKAVDWTSGQNFRCDFCGAVGYYTDTEVAYYTPDFGPEPPYPHRS